jgi:hypothetical protein
LWGMGRVMRASSCVNRTARGIGAQSFSMCK